MIFYTRLNLLIDIKNKADSTLLCFGCLSTVLFQNSQRCQTCIDFPTVNICIFIASYNSSRSLKVGKIVADSQCISHKGEGNFYHPIMLTTQRFSFKQFFIPLAYIGGKCILSIYTRSNSYLLPLYISFAIKYDVVIIQYYLVHPRRPAYIIVLEYKPKQNKIAMPVVYHLT